MGYRGNGLGNILYFVSLHNFFDKMSLIFVCNIAIEPHLMSIIIYDISFKHS